MKSRAPIVKALNLTPEKIAELKHIMATAVITKRKEAVREALGGCLCSVCNEIPTYSVTYDYVGLTRREAYCDRCFDNVYQKNKNISINDIAETYNCTIAESGSISKIKVEGYETKPKSSQDATIMCSKCRVTRICFDETMRGHNNTLIPLEYNNNFRIHDCDYSYPFFCQWCDAKLVFNRTMRTDNGKLIPLHFEDDSFHVCPKKP